MEYRKRRGIMKGIDFSSKASFYEENALVQKAASEVLLNLVSIKENEDVLDLGCGSGGVTRKIALLTRGVVVGADLAVGMINEAVRSGNNQGNVSYLVRDAEKLGFTEKFDVIYCNSAFQWFPDPKKVLQQCFAALKPGGRMGIQAPATSMYCPNFVTAVERVKANPLTRGIFNFFKSPWMFLDTAEEYRDLFEGCGFQVTHCRLSEESSRYTPEQAYNIYKSGAENGYLNQAYYSVQLTNEYIDTFRLLVKESIKEQTDQSGMVDLKFVRIYLVAEKN
ncbi:MAG: methyltransferase domain-containing protein [Bacillota bacterium]